MFKIINLKLSTIILATLISCGKYVTKITKKVLISFICIIRNTLEYEYCLLNNEYLCKSVYGC